MKITTELLDFIIDFDKIFSRDYEIENFAEDLFVIHLGDVHLYLGFDGDTVDFFQIKGMTCGKELKKEIYDFLSRFMSVSTDKDNFEIEEI